MCDFMSVGLDHKICDRSISGVNLCVFASLGGLYAKPETPVRVSRKDRKDSQRRRGLKLTLEMGYVIYGSVIGKWFRRVAEEFRPIEGGE